MHTNNPTSAALLPGSPGDRASYALPLWLLLLLAFAGPANGAQLEPYTGQGTPEFRLPDLQDREHALADYRGKVVLVNFWASWCPPCIQEMPELVGLHERFADAPFEILALDVGEKKYRVRKFVKLIGFDLPVLLDTSRAVAGDFGVETLPTSFLIDADGRIRYRVLGSPGWDDAQAIGVVEQLLSEVPQRATPTSTVNDTGARQ